MYQPRIGSYAVYEPNEEGWYDWQKQIAKINTGLTSRGLEVISAPEAIMDDASCRRVGDFFAEKKLDALHALITSWSFDHHTVEIHQKINRPVVVRATPASAPSPSSAPCSSIASSQILKFRTGCIMAIYQKWKPLIKPKPSCVHVVFKKN